MTAFSATKILKIGDALEVLVPTAVAYFCCAASFRHRHPVCYSICPAEFFVYLHFSASGLAFANLSFKKQRVVIARFCWLVFTNHVYNIPLLPTKVKPFLSSFYLIFCRYGLQQQHFSTLSLQAGFYNTSIFPASLWSPTSSIISQYTIVFRSRCKTMVSITSRPQTASQNHTYSTVYSSRSCCRQCSGNIVTIIRATSVTSSSVRQRSI